MKEYFFHWIGFYFMWGWTTSTDERVCLKILSWGQGSGKKKKNSSMINKMLLISICSLLPLDYPKSAET